MAELTNNDISTIIKILQKIPLLAELNETDHREIVKRITLEYYPQNHIIFNEGDEGDAFYIIKRGVVRVFQKAKEDQLEKDMAMLGDNDFFGEMALMSDKPRNATTMTMEESEIFKLTKEDFLALVSANPDMAGRISSEFLKRLKLNLRT